MLKTVSLGNLQITRQDVKTIASTTTFFSFIKQRQYVHTVKFVRLEVRETDKSVHLDIIFQNQVLKTHLFKYHYDPNL